MLLSIAVFLTVAVAAAWGFLIYKSSVYRAEMSVIAQAIADASIKVSKDTLIQESLDEARASVEEISGYFIAESEIPDFISLIEKSAKDRGVSLGIGSINFAVAAEGESSRTLSLRLTGTGAWRDLINFVIFIEGLPNALDIKGLNLVAGDGGWNLSADIVQHVTK